MMDEELVEQKVDIQPVEEVEIQVYEGVGWDGGEGRKHADLPDRYEPDQHIIGSISGLREELDDIESLKTVYSDQYNAANYYEWANAIPEDTGYFVSLVLHTDKIAVCTGGDIFGVSVDHAGFIGGQNTDDTKKKTSGLIVTSGFVGVRCESDVVEGDCVVSNAYGIASKTNSECGYKVIALGNKNGILYAYIVLGVQACTTDMLGKKVNNLTSRVDANEVNIAAAMQTANEAYKKAEESTSSNESMGEQVSNVTDRMNEAESKVNDFGEQVGNIATVAEQAREVANSATTLAESMHTEAVEKAEEALSKAGEIEKTVEPINQWTYTDPVTGETNTGAEYFAEYVKNGLSTKAEMETVNRFDEENKLLIEKNAENYTRMLSSIDKYSVGECSQAYGLTVEKAKNILKEGMIYIPTQVNGKDTHTETYVNGDTTVERIFTYGFCYIWTNDTLWSEQPSGQVWFGENEPEGNAYTYWYNGDILYLLNNSLWVEIATLAGNINNRITSMVRQNVNDITAEIVNARGSGTSLSERLNDTDAIVESTAFWRNNDGSKYVATFQQKASGSGSNLTLIAHRVDTSDETEKDEDIELKGAKLVIGQDGKDSYVNIDADNIVLDGSVAFTKKENGVTKINGGNIATGSITATQIDATNLHVKAANIDNKLTASQINANGITAIGVDISGKLTATEGSFSNCTVNDTCDIKGIIKGNTICAHEYSNSQVNTSGKMQFQNDKNGQYDLGLFSSFTESPFDEVVKIGNDIPLTDLPYEAVYSIKSSNSKVANVYDDGGVWAGTAVACGVSIITVYETTPDGDVSKGSLTICVTEDGTSSSVLHSTESHLQLYTQSEKNGVTTAILTTNAYLNDVDMGRAYISLESGAAIDSEAYLYASKINCEATNGELNGTWHSQSAIVVDSDRKLKHDIQDVDDRYIDLVNVLPVRRFKYNNGQSGRYHVGVILDELKASMDQVGLDSSELAAYCIESNSGGVRYEELTMLCMKALQSINKKIEHLSEEIEMLKGKLGNGPNS